MTSLRSFQVGAVVWFWYLGLIRLGRVLGGNRVLNLRENKEVSFGDETCYAWQTSAAYEAIRSKGKIVLYGERHVLERDKMAKTAA